MDGLQWYDGKTACELYGFDFFFSVVTVLR
jgi:hypothetical protein